MARKTRAAQKAAEGIDIEIAEDNVHVQLQNDGSAHLTDKKSDTARPPLVEMTANAVEELKLALDTKDSGKGTTRQPRAGTKKGKPKPKKEDQASEATDSDKAGSVSPGKDENDEPPVDSVSSTEPWPVMQDTLTEAPIAAEEVSHDQGPSVSKFGSDGAQETLCLKHEEEQSINDTEPPAVQKLESIFTQPQTEVTDSAKPPAVEAIAVPLPMSPEKRARASASPQRSTKSSTLKSKPHNKSTTNPEVKRRMPDTLKRTSTVASAPRMSIRGASRPSTVRMSTTSKPRPSSVQIATGSPAANKEKKERTVIALNTPPKLAKSTKPLTKSTFELPSETLKEKFKAQKEERQRRQEQQAEKSKENTLKPSIPPKHTTKPRVTSQATINPILAHRPRASISGTTEEAPTATKSVAKVTRTKAATVRPSGRPSILNKNLSSTAIVRESRAPGGRISSVSKPTSEPAIMTAAQKAEAAKKARAEAAEKGRAASREWAQKKKQELDAKKAAKK